MPAALWSRCIMHSAPASGRHYLFVDFENVQRVDLKAFIGRDLEVTLVVGEQQKNLSIELVQQLLERREQVRIIRTGQGGRNALDFILAFHLGQAVATDPGGDFHILSRDKDFDPLVRHLKGQGVRLARHDSLAAVPGVGRAGGKPAAPPASARAAAERKPVKSAVSAATPAPKPAPAAAKPPPARPAPAPARVATPASTPATRPSELAERVDVVARYIRRNKTGRPVRRVTLLRHINDRFGKDLSEPEQQEILDALVAEGLVAVGPTGRVTYLD
jgi:hypothetical protein